MSFAKALLGLVCFATLLAAGAIDAVDTSLSDVLSAPELLARGLPFAITALTCLAIRELARLVGAKLMGGAFAISWPIPALSFLGTLGAVPATVETTDRKRGFDLGVVEFLAGWCVALPLLALGIHAADPLDNMGGAPMLRANLAARSLLFEGLLRWLKPDSDNVWLQPTGFAGWVALYVLALNFLPIGRSAGGQLLAAVSSRFHLPVTAATSLACFAYAALARDYVLAVWVMVVLVTGARHPGFSDTAPVGRGRIAGLFAMLLLVIIALPLRARAGW